jgi:hypothetical protein
MPPPSLPPCWAYQRYFLFNGTNRKKMTIKDSMKSENEIQMWFRKNGNLLRIDKEKKPERKKTINDSQETVKWVPQDRHWVGENELMVSFAKKDIARFLHCGQVRFCIFLEPSKQ